MDTARIYVQPKYMFDFDKINSQEDLMQTMIAVLKALKISFYGEECIRGIEHLVKKIEKEEE